MARSRPRALPARPESSELTARMVGIGMNFAAAPRVGADIEATLVHASELGMDEGELRVLSILTTWLGVHHAHVNADRLVRLVAESPSLRVASRWRTRGRQKLTRRQQTARVAKQKPPRSDPRGLRRFSPEHRASCALRVMRRCSRACSQRAPSERDERRVGQLSRSRSCPVGREERAP